MAIGERGRRAVQSLHHSDRQPHFEAHDKHGPDEWRGRDANYREAALVQENLFSDDLGVAAELRPPEMLTQDHYRMAARIPIFFRQERATEGRLDAERI